MMFMTLPFPRRLKSAPTINDLVYPGLRRAHILLRLSPRYPSAKHAYQHPGHRSAHPLTSGSR